MSEERTNYSAIECGGRPKVIWEGPNMAAIMSYIQNRYSQASKAEIDQMMMRGEDIAFVGYVPPTRWQNIRWAVSSYFTNLWSAIRGRREYD